jgi:hypothetical protein
MEFLHDLLEWFMAVIEHWHGYVSGTALAFGLELIKKFRDWEPSKKIFTGIVALGLIGSLFSAWRDEHAKVIQLGSPNLKIEIITLMTGPKPPGSHVGLILKLTNLGSPSSVRTESWKLLAITRSGTHQGILLGITTDEPYENCQTGTGMGFRFTREDEIFEKSSRVIERYGQETGVILFNLPFLTDIQQLNDPATKFEISVEDAARHKFTIEESMKSLMARTAPAFLSGIKYPGSLPLPQCKGK